MLQIRGPVTLLFLYHLDPTDVYDDFKIPKHLSISPLQHLNDLKICDY